MRWRYKPRERRKQRAAIAARVARTRAVVEELRTRHWRDVATAHDAEFVRRIWASLS